MGVWHHNPLKQVPYLERWRATRIALLRESQTPVYQVIRSLVPACFGKFIGSSITLCGSVVVSRFHIRRLLNSFVSWIYGYVEVERKGPGRGKGVASYISPTKSVERKALLDALKDLA
jgi:hypothetical protein